MGQFIYVYLTISCAHADQTVRPFEKNERSGQKHPTPRKHLVVGTSAPFFFVFLFISFFSLSVYRGSWRIYVASVIAQRNGVALYYYY